MAAPTITEKLTFLTAAYCPYAQRTWIALNAKGVEYSPILVDLANKPEWFFRYNPLGKVPTLIYEDEEGIHSLYESLICNEFVNELPGKKLLPEHAAKRARARIIIDRFNGAAASSFLRVMFGQDEGLLSTVPILRKELQWLEQQLDAAGPFFLGSHLSLVDAAILPWFLRLPVMEDIKGFSLLEELPRLQEWVGMAKTLPAVAAACHRPDPKLSYEENLKAGYMAYYASRA